MIRHAIFTFVGVGGVLLTFYPTIFGGFERMQPEAGDVLLNNLFLEHTYRWAFDRNYGNSFWSPGFYYPTPDSFTYSETLVGTAPIYWMLRGVGFSETIAGQLWILITFALNYASMAVVLRWFGVNTLFAAAGAYVFAFGLIRADQLNHQHLMPHYFAPFAVWYAWTFLREPSTRRWAMLVGLSAAQVFASLHLGWFLGLGLGVFLGLGLCSETGSCRRVWRFAISHPLGILAPLVTSGVAVGWYASNFYRGAPSPRAYWESAFYCPFFDHWFAAADGSLWSDHLTWRNPEDLGEKRLFQGFTVYALFLVSIYVVYRLRFAARGFVIAGVGTAFILMLIVTKWSGDASLWYVIHKLVPGANAFRAVGRISFSIYLFGLIGGLVGTQEMLNQASRFKARAMTILIASLMILEQVRPLPESFDKKKDFLEPKQSLVPMLTEVDTAYVMYDGTRPDYRHEIIAMWAGHWAKTPVMNGFSGAAPRGHPGFGARPSLEELLQILGPQWQGKLAIIEWGPPVTRRAYQVVPGGEASRRAVLIES